MDRIIGEIDKVLLEPYGATVLALIVLGQIVVITLLGCLMQERISSRQQRLLPSLAERLRIVLRAVPLAKGIGQPISRVRI